LKLWQIEANSLEKGNGGGGGGGGGGDDDDDDDDDYDDDDPCKILGFHGGDYEEWCLLGCYAVWLL
jgi:hypothetical protein